MAGQQRIWQIATTLLASSTLVQAGFSVALEWDPSPDTNAVGYVLYHGVLDSDYLVSVDLGNQNDAVVSNLVEGVTNFFYVTTYDAERVAGEPSNLIQMNFPGSYPPPTISAMDDQMSGKNMSAGPVAFTIGDTLFDPSRLILSATSSNPDLVPGGNILFGGSGSNRTVTVVPTLNAAGNTRITVSLDDGLASSSTSFLYTVDPDITPELTTLLIQAESGTLSASMTANDDPSASGGQFIATSEFVLGAATFTVNVPVAGAYLIWWRARERVSAYPFIVVVDEEPADVADIFHATGVTRSKGWLWRPVGGSFRFLVSDVDGSFAKSTVVPLTAGLHKLSIWGLEPDMLLDEMLITNDRKLTPTPPILTVPPDQKINELSTLVATNTAIGFDLSNVPLTFSLAAGPSGVTLNPTNGVLTWTPTEAQGPSTNLIYVQVTDHGSPSLLEIKSFKVVVSEVNNGAPALTVPPDIMIDELATLVIQTSATDPDIAPSRPTFSLLAAPEGMLIDPDTGVLTWKPSEVQGPSTNLITVEVSDNGSPPMSDSESFRIVVDEVNSPPVLTVPRNRTIHQLATLVVTNTAIDSDWPVNTLTFHLVSAPDGVQLDPTTGVLSWTPTEAQRFTTNLITLSVTDNGTPPLSEIGSFMVAVSEVNNPPEIAQVPPQTIRPGSLLTITNTAFDPDIPPDQLTFSLGADAPAGATIEPFSGVFTWKPTASQADSTNSVTIWITDNGLPEGKNSTTFEIVVGKLAPIIVTSVSLENGDIRLRATGDAGIRYSLQFSVDLVTWSSLPGVEAPGDDFELVDTDVATHPYRFYRVMTQ